MSTDWRSAATAALLLILSSLACLAQAADQSLAEVIRRNKPTHKAARVVTNDEIPSVTPVSVSPANSSSADEKANITTDASSAGATPAARDQSGKTSKSGITVPGLLNNGSLEQAKALLEGLKHDRQALLDNYDKIEKKLAETDDDSLRRIYSDSLARRHETMARNEKAIAETESAIQAAQAADAQGGKNETQ